MILYSHIAHTAHTFKIGGLFAADPLTQAGDTKWAILMHHMLPVTTNIAHRLYLIVIDI